MQLNKKKTASVLEFYESQLGSVINALYIMRQEIRELLKTLEEEEEAKNEDN